MSAWISLEGIILQTECRCFNFMCTMIQKFGRLFFSMRALNLEKLFLFGRDGSLLLCCGLSLSEQVLPFLVLQLLRWLLLLLSTCSRRRGSVVTVHRPSCSMACGILSEQEPHPCPLHWQANSHPLYQFGRLLRKNWKSLNLVGNRKDGSNSKRFLSCQDFSLKLFKEGKSLFKRALTLKRARTEL